MSSLDSSTEDFGVAANCNSFEAVKFSLSSIEEYLQNLQQARRKLTELTEEHRKVKETLLELIGQLSVGQEVLVSKECVCVHLGIKIIVFDRSCIELQADCAVIRENLMKSRQELQELNSAMLLSSMEFSRTWNCTISGGMELREEMRNQKIECVKNLRCRLYQDLQTFFTNKRDYEIALEDRMKFEKGADMQMINLATKESSLYEKLEVVENAIQKLQNPDESNVMILHHHESDKLRLENRIKSTKLSIARMKSLNSECQRGCKNRQVNEKRSQRSQIISMPKNSNIHSLTSRSTQGQCEFSKQKNLQVIRKPPIKVRRVSSTADEDEKSLRSKFAITTQEPQKRPKTTDFNDPKFAETSSWSSTIQKFHFKKKLSSTPVPITSSLNSKSVCQTFKPKRPCPRHLQGVTSAKNVHQCQSNPRAQQSSNHENSY